MAITTCSCKKNIWTISGLKKVLKMLPVIQDLNVLGHELYWFVNSVSGAFFLKLINVVSLGAAV
jgi:hypothetical protein